MYVVDISIAIIHIPKNTRCTHDPVYSLLCISVAFVILQMYSLNQLVKNTFCSVLVLWEPKLTESMSCWIQIAACVTGEQLSYSLWYGYIKMYIYIYIFFVVGIYDSNITANHSEVSGSINPLKPVVKLGINNFIAYLAATYIRSQPQYEKKIPKKNCMKCRKFLDAEVALCGIYLEVNKCLTIKHSPVPCWAIMGALNISVAFINILDQGRA